MTQAVLRKYLLEKKGAFECLPFGPDVLVYKVINKMFALVPLDENSPQINLKCDPDDAIALRSMFESVKPGYHMNKEHWNTVVIDGSIPEKIVLEMIDNSYDLVVSKLKKTDKEKIK